MNLYAESNGTAATRGYVRRVSGASTPIFAASTTSAASVGSPTTSPVPETVASLSRHNPYASSVKSGTASPATWVIFPDLA